MTTEWQTIEDDARRTLQTSAEQGLEPFIPTVVFFREERPTVIVELRDHDAKDRRDKMEAYAEALAVTSLINPDQVAIIIDVMMRTLEEDEGFEDVEVRPIEDPKSVDALMLLRAEVTSDGIEMNPMAQVYRLKDGGKVVWEEPMDLSEDRGESSSWMEDMLMTALSEEPLTEIPEELSHLFDDLKEFRRECLKELTEMGHHLAVSQPYNEEYL